MKRRAALLEGAIIGVAGNLAEGQIVVIQPTDQAVARDYVQKHQVASSDAFGIEIDVHNSLRTIIEPRPIRRPAILRIYDNVNAKSGRRAAAKQWMIM